MADLIYSLLNKSIPRAGVIIKCKDEYLCVFQSESRLWGFPKGRLDGYESFKDGARRELMEETGIFVPTDFLNDFIHLKRGKHHHFYYLIQVTEKPPVTVDNDEITGYEWMTLDTLKKRNTSFFTEQAIRKLSEV